jgi:hypothetical protein
MAQETHTKSGTVMFRINGLALPQRLLDSRFANATHACDIFFSSLWTLAFSFAA